MKIVFLTHYDNMYGANRALFQLMKGLKVSYDAEIILVIPAEGEMTKALAQLGIRYEICPVTQWQAVYRSPLRFLVKQRMRKKQIEAELADLVSRFQNEKIDFVHSNSSVIGTGAMLAEKLGCKHIWHIREFSKEHFHMEYFYPAKYVKNLYEKAECLVTISDAMKENYRLKYPNANVLRIYDGVSLSDEDLDKANIKFDTSELLKMEAGNNKPVRFCYVGYLFPMKHQLDVIEACQRLEEQKFTNYEMYFVGNGKPEYEKKLRSRIQKYGLKHVKLLGYHSDVQEILKTMDVGIIASEYEGFGLVTVEYMLHHLPVIGRSSGGTAEIVEDGVTGCLYDEKDGLVAAMKLMMEDEERRKRMGEAGYLRAKNHFTEEMNTKCMMELYGMLLGENS